MPKTKLTLLIDEALIEEMKVRVLREKTSVSAIVEQFFRDYLKRKVKK